MEKQVIEQLIKHCRQQVSRRHTLKYIAGAATTFILPACGGRSDRVNASNNQTACTEIKYETGGPFTADGTNGTDVLSDSAVFRHDIRANLDGSNVQPGAEFQVTVTVIDISNNCAPVVGAAVYLWHCNAQGQYSAYDDMGQSDQTNETYLRGVQITDKAGQVTFTTIYPGQYPGRAPHIHARIYRNNRFDTELQTTQFAFADSTNAALYSSSRIYAKSQASPAITNDRDILFSDGFAGQLLSISGDPTSGYTGTIVLGVNA